MACCKDKKNGCSRVVQDQSDYLVCTCMGVMRQEIIEAIKSGNDTFEGLSDALGVGTGCSSCVAEVLDILKQEKSSGCCKS